MENNNFYANLIENDLNPFILFDNNGKIKDFNQEAEFLFNFVKPKELYELAVSHASINFGFNRQFISLKYGKIQFYAILVGYINDEEIGLRLYKEVCREKEVVKITNIELANIFSLIELSKTTTLLQSDIKIEEIYDISIPQVKLNINEFLLILNDCFTFYKDEKELSLKVYIKTGEYEIIEEKKYQIISLEFKANSPLEIHKSLENKLSKTHINLFFSNNILNLELPMIL
ncbi:MAG: hypothetical protein KAQ94_09270 [Arcobacteraceae bacterium]|nr:hypothetical protein [Arcobacteraceae bacterium]